MRAHRRNPRNAGFSGPRSQTADLNSFWMSMGLFYLTCHGQPRLAGADGVSKPGEPVDDRPLPALGCAGWLGSFVGGVRVGRRSSGPASIRLLWKSQTRSSGGTSNTPLRDARNVRTSGGGSTSNDLSAATARAFPKYGGCISAPSNTAGKTVVTKHTPTDTRCIEFPWFESF